MPDTMELTADEQALLDADRADKTPVEAEQKPTAVEPEPSGKPSPAVEAEPATAVGAEPETPTTVPYGAFAEERARRKEIEKARAKDREELARLTGRIEEFNRFLAPKQEQQAKPTVAEQPIEVLSDVASRLDAMEQQRQHEIQWGQFNAAVQNATREFEAANPDFGEAIKHLEAARVRELRAIGLPDDRIQATIQAEAVQISGLSLEQGRNPANVFYKLAQERGYQRADQAPEASSAAPQRAPNGQFTAADKLAQIAKGQQGAGRSLSGAGGGSGGGDLTLEAMGAMTQDEFAEWASVPANEKAWQRLMGG